MLFFAICEDQTYFSDQLRDMLEGYLRKRNLKAQVMAFSSGEELLAFGSAPNVILMDIKLPGKNGIEIIENLKSRGAASQVVFITSYREYVFRAFDLDAVHYLLKPITTETLYEAVDRAVRRGEYTGEKTILLTKAGRTFRIPVRDILYCEVFDHQIFVHTLTESFQTSGTLESFEKKLDSRFFRCHRSYLVNMDAVVEKAEGMAVVAGGGKVLISRRKQQEFANQLLKVCRKEEGWEV